MTSHFFDSIPLAPRDPILGLTELIAADPRPHKVNLTVGVYQDGLGKTPVLQSVKKMEARLAEICPSRNYLGIDGLAEFNTSVRSLLMASEPATGASLDSRVATVQSPGGTGGLRIAADFLATHRPGKKIWLSDPTWPNHPTIFAAAGLETSVYAYLAKDRPLLAKKSLLDDLERIPEGDVVLLHGCCHNPTGVDPSEDEWRQIVSILRKRNLLPLVDFAYQGFGKGIRQDTFIVELLASDGGEAIVCQSFSKNFGLYAERVGALHVICRSSESAKAVLSQLKAAIRANYSNPPAHGARVVAGVLADKGFREEWEHELNAMRERIQAMRQGLVQGLVKQGVARDIGYLLNQSGMFSYTGLLPAEVKRLQDEFAVYMVGSGRINVAGLHPGNLDAVCQAIAAVWK